MQLEPPGFRRHSAQTSDTQGFEIDSAGNKFTTDLLSVGVNDNGI
jgi:hypothetical protein